MSFSTGIYRLAQVIKWAGRLLALGLTVGMLFAERASNGNWMSETKVMFLAGAALFLLVSQPLAWVLEGFSKE